ncbi:MAG: hypothetical protein J7K90_00260 [Desulfuromusa sp.]|nr:hypothetical protein [Desulfuromusa sp.]
MALNVDFEATEKLQLNAGVTYNKSDDSMDMSFTQRDPIYLEGADTSDTDNALALSAIEGTPTAAVNYDNWQLNNEIDSYSELDYEQYSFTLGGTYNFTDAFYTKVQGTYDIFESNDYDVVYGDEDGEALSGYVAIGYKF